MSPFVRHVLDREFSAHSYKITGSTKLSSKNIIRNVIDIQLGELRLSPMIKSVFPFSTRIFVDNKSLCFAVSSSPPRERSLRDVQFLLLLRLFTEGISKSYSLACIAQNLSFWERIFWLWLLWMFDTSGYRWLQFLILSAAFLFCRNGVFMCILDNIAVVTFSSCSSSTVHELDVNSCHPSPDFLIRFARWAVVPSVVILFNRGVWS